MATQEVLQVHGTSLLFADATDFPNAGAGPPSTAANDIREGTGTKVQLDLTGIAATNGRQSDKTADLGAAWSREWLLGACIEWEAAPTAGGVVEFWWNGSPNSTAATGNSGGASGADGAFTVAGKSQLYFLGAMTVLNNVINIDAAIRTFHMPHRYGSLIVINLTDQAFRSTAVAMDETHIVLTPIIPDIQAAA